MWEGDCQVVCVNNKEIIGLFSLRLSLQWPWGPCWGWAGARSWHYTQLRQQGGGCGGSNGGGRGGPRPVIHLRDVFVPQARPRQGPSQAGRSSLNQASVWR